MKIVKLKQGSPEWHAHRARYFNASDAPAMMGCSPYKTREQLVRELATGIGEEITPQKQAVFDAGHRAEALARPLAEQIVGQELYPVVGVADSGPYSASMDGLTMGEDVNLEHKALNQALREVMTPECQGSDLPMVYQVQMEHQCMVCPTIERTLFMASKWDDQGNLIEARHCWYTPNLQLRAQIVEGWAALERDVAAYDPTVDQPKARLEAKAKDAALPAIRIEVRGEVLASNVEELRALAVGRIALVKTELTTDQDFVDARVDAAWLREVAASMKMGLQMVRGGMETVDALMTMLEQVEALAERKAIDLENLVTSESKRRKDDVVAKAQAELNDHIKKHNAELGADYLPMVVGPLAAAAKGLKTIDSTEKKVGAALLAEKAKADALALCFTRNRAYLHQDGVDWITVFPDFAATGSKSQEDFQAVATQRIDRAKEAARTARELSDAREKLVSNESAAQAEIAQAAQTGTLAAPVAADLGALVREQHAEAVAGLDAQQVIGTAQRAAAGATYCCEQGEQQGLAGKGCDDCAEASAGYQAAMFATKERTGPPTLRIGTIKERLGHMTVTADDLRALGFEPAGRERAAPLYHEDDFPEICEAIAAQALSAKAEFLKSRTAVAA